MALGYNKSIEHLQAGSGYTTAQQSPCDMPRYELQAIGDDLAQTLNILHELNKRAITLADRLLGSAPTPTGKSEASPNPSSMVGQLSGVANYLRNSVLQLSDELARLERL